MTKLSKLKEIVTNHKWVVFLAIVASILASAPQVYFRYDHRDDGIYQGIELIPDSPWSPRIREIQDGNGFGSIYYKDGKNDPTLFQPLSSGLVAYMGLFFSLDINNTLLLSRIVLPFFTLLIMYTFIYLLSRDKLVSLSASALLLFADTILNPSGLTQVLSGINYSSFLDIARPVHPTLIYIPFFAFLSLYWMYYRSKDYKYGILSALVLGLNFYSYFYTWTYLYAFGSVLGLIYLIRRDWEEAKRIFLVYLGGAIISIPNWIGVYQASKYTTYVAVGERFGIVATREPMFIGIVVSFALVLFLVFYPRKDLKKYLFCMSFLLAPIVTLNQQLITGKILQPGHYHWYFHKTTAIILILMVLFYWLSILDYKSWRRILSVFIIAVSVSVGSFIQASTYIIDRDGRDGGHILIERQKYGPVMSWLSDNARAGSVIFANEETSHMTVIYTPYDVFYHRAAYASLSATKERLVEVLFAFYRLRGLLGKDVREVFIEERKFLSWNVYGIYYRELFGSYDAIPDDRIDELIELYKATLVVPTDEWLRKIWEKHEVNYLIWDKEEDPLWQLDQYEYLENVVDFGDISIYRFNS